MPGWGSHLRCEAWILRPIQSLDARVGLDADHPAKGGRLPDGPASETDVLGLHSWASFSVHGAGVTHGAAGACDHWGFHRLLYDVRGGDGRIVIVSEGNIGCGCTVGLDVHAEGLVWRLADQTKTARSHESWGETTAVQKSICDAFREFRECG